MIRAKFLESPDDANGLRERRREGEKDRETESIIVVVVGIVESTR